MLIRKMLRTVWRYKVQFLSMILMIALGSGVFLGFNIEWVSLSKNTASFFEQTGFADYRIVSADGFSAQDADAIAAIDGVDAVSRYLSVDADVEGTRSTLALTVTENPAVSFFVVTEGEAYDPQSTDGLWLFDQYAARNGVACGDELTLCYGALTIRGTVRGLIEASEQMICVRDESQIMPDFGAYGYVYLSPAAYGAVMDAAGAPTVYPQLNVRSALSKADFCRAANEALGSTLMVLTKNESISYAEAKGEENEGKTMASVLPVLFLLIAALTMVTTMHRIVAAEKTQIGTLKALGFQDGRILRHYTSFAFTVGLVGIGLGILLGFGIGRFIMNPKGMMGTYIVMPSWKLYMPWWCWPILLGMLALLTGIGALSTRRMLRGTAAEALAPYTPKKMRRLAAERLPLWERLGFGARWNLRDILRHKARSGMTLLGVLGCMVLLVGGFGMLDTVDRFLDSYYTDVAVYASRIYLADDAAPEAALLLAGRYDGDLQASIGAELGEKTVSLDVYDLRHGNLRFWDEGNGVRSLPDDGALVCIRLVKELGLRVGDELLLSPYGTAETYRVRVAGQMRSTSLSVALSAAYADTLTSEDGTRLTQSAAFRYNSVYTAADKAEIAGEGISTVQSKQDVMASFDSFMQILYLAVGVLIAASVLLGVVVLYNLGVMSYLERYREMATLKVIGFKDRRIGRLLVGQNLLLSVLGAALGLPLGVRVLNWLMDNLAAEYEMKLCLGPLTFLGSAALTLAVSAAVSCFIARKSRKIDMVAALKTGE